MLNHQAVCCLQELEGVEVFGVVQGGDIQDERLRSARETAKRPVAGFCLDGLQTGAVDQNLRTQLISAVTKELPEDKPRSDLLMNVWEMWSLITDTTRGDYWLWGSPGSHEIKTSQPKGGVEVGRSNNPQCCCVIHHLDFSEVCVTHAGFVFTKQPHISLEMLHFFLPYSWSWNHRSMPAGIKSNDFQINKCLQSDVFNQISWSIKAAAEDYCQDF